MGMFVHILSSRRINMIEQMEFRSKKKNKGFEIIPLKAFFESVDASFIKKQYRTNFYNLIFVTEGKCTHEIDFMEYTVRAGETLVISNNRVHKYSDFENADGYLVMFTEGFLCEFLSNQNSEVKDLFKYSYLNPHIKSTDLYSSNITALLDVINDMYVNTSKVLNEQIIASAFKTLVLLMWNSRFRSSTPEAQKNEMFVQFTDLVEKNISHEKSVEGYAKMMHVSEKTVNQVTRKAIDMSAKQYIIQHLIQKIKVKLSFEQKSINEIADELGFSETSNMTRFFKNTSGVSPNEFRKRIRTEKSDLFRSESIDLNFIKDSIEENVYHILPKAVVPLHKHEGHDEIFYCFKGSGCIVLEDCEVELSIGQSFVVPAGSKHSLRSDSELYVIAILVPVMEERSE